MKIIKLLFAIIFLIFALLQVNDPDPALWIFIYGSVALLFALSVAMPISSQLVVAMICGCLAYSLLFLPGVFDLFIKGEASDVTATMKAGTDYIEETREFLGLWIIIGALMLLYKKGR